MVYSYYPGCTLKTKAKDLDAYARACAKVLGFELEELENWQCCGGVYPLGSDEIATKLSSVRALAAAKEKGQDLVTVCAACHHVLKRVNDDMKNVEDIRFRANNYMELDEPYAGETKVLHFLEILRDRIGFAALKDKVVKPLTGRKIGAYYGCLLLRPSDRMQFDDPENPSIIEDFIRALGAEPVIYPYRNECCGGYISLKEKDMAKNQTDLIMESAAGMGAETLVTACPLCRYNLNQSRTQEKVPVVYFTELLAEALGVKAEAAETNAEAAADAKGNTKPEADTDKTEDMQEGGTQS
ncbi:MAG: CoB--CoM heterodisulfide reductase iron-sulfur subunit B family protein [Lachnospiraceae bacterium]|nr:CoB--CoM heterodisulfide reductase iron-sulfur subunit B family protein [Lachnospiraceae bacterium]